MSNGRRMILAGLGWILGLLVFSVGHPTEAHEQSSKRPSPHRIGRVEMGNPVIGKQLFQEKRCVKCHSIKGNGGRVGPDLGRIQHTHNIYQMASIMWNHSTQMRQVMEERGIKRPEFKGEEMAHLLAYLHSLEVMGDPDRGKVVFERKGCVRCHSINGEGGKIGPELAQTSHPHPPIELTGMMWNHSPTMTAMMGALGVPRPVFEANEMVDLLAYLQAVQREAARGHPAGAPHHHH
ncbi:MAG: c-type cytochrome [Candidatus Methylomirabilia bacterium]